MKFKITNGEIEHSYRDKTVTVELMITHSPDDDAAMGAACKEASSNELGGWSWSGCGDEDCNGQRTTDFYRTMDVDEDDLDHHVVMDAKGAQRDGKKKLRAAILAALRA